MELFLEVSFRASTDSGACTETGSGLDFGTITGCGLELINIGERVKQLLGFTHVLSLFTVCGEHTIRIP